MTGLDQQWVEANLEQFFELWQRVLGKKQTESRLGPSTRHDTIRYYTIRCCNRPPRPLIGFLPPAASQSYPSVPRPRPRLARARARASPSPRLASGARAAHASTARPVCAVVGAGPSVERESRLYCAEVVGYALSSMSAFFSSCADMLSSPNVAVPCAEFLDNVLAHAPALPVESRSSTLRLHLLQCYRGLLTCPGAAATGGAALRKSLPSLLKFAITELGCVSPSCLPPRSRKPPSPRPPLPPIPPVFF